MNLKKRNRILYLLLVVLTIFAGLASRSYSNALPDFISAYLGDVLWALMVFWGCGLIFAKWRIRTNFLISLIFCYSIELSQLYQAEWINQIRQTTLGGLILGYGFLWSDLICYTIGITAGVLVEYCILHKKVSSY